MLDPVIDFVEWVFDRIGRGIGFVIAAILWPFVAGARWYRKRGWIIKGPIGILLLLLLFGYGHLIWSTQVWNGFDRDYAKRYRGTQETASVSAGEPQISTGQTTGLSGSSTSVDNGSGQCAPSKIVEAVSDLVDMNVNQNNWVPSMFFSKLGLFGLEWKKTPFLDNKAAFQLGILSAQRRTAIELVDRLGRVRGTSGIDQDLQDAREKLSYDEASWYFSFDPFGPRSTSQANYKSALRSLQAFNSNLQKCQTNFDARPDNLLQFLDRIASDIGATSDILRTRMEASNAGWFDPRADDRFWFAYGQLYAYSGILSATRTDFADVFSNRNLDSIWDRTQEQLRAALNMTPAIISNGAEASWIMPTHLATMGFYVLRVRSNLVEIRQILNR